MMEYNAFEIGPALEQIRKDKKMTREDVSAVTGLSVSSIKQIEYGIRNLSMRALYLFMEAYECDANTLLNLDTNKEVSLDAKLMKLPKEKRDYFMRSFSFMIDGMSGMQVVGR